MTTKRLGFACKWIDRADQVDGIGPRDDCKKYNTGATTVAWLKRQNSSQAEDKLWDLVKQNIEATYQLVKRVGNLEPNLRMVRLSSDILPMYTEPSYSYFYKQKDVQDYAARQFARIGDVARQQDVRLSMHPGQFVVLASDNPDIVRRSIEEFEYHVDMARWMGYGSKKLDFKINIHLSGRKKVDGFNDAWQQLTPEARNCITLENDEYQVGIDELIALKDKVGIVLDIHHHFIHSHGEYIKADDDRIKHIIDSWQGVRPTIHYSISREDYLIGHSTTAMLDYKKLLSEGYKRQQMRAHSDAYWNKAVNAWAKTHWEWADVMCESKLKNLASFKLYEEWKNS